MRASYREGVAWIADNDEPTESSPYEVSGQISVLLLADLFRKEPRDVAIAVLRHRGRWCRRCENAGIYMGENGMHRICACQKK